MAGPSRKSKPVVVNEADPKPRSRYGRWRAGTLLLVYVLMAAHVTHWIVTGKTLAPLELNEVMYTFELGIVTAGFLFMAVAVLVLLQSRDRTAFLPMRDYVHYILERNVLRE